MSNPESKPPAEELESWSEEESSSEGGSWLDNNEDQETRPLMPYGTQLVFTDWDPNLSVAGDIERVEYGHDPVALRRAFKRAKRRMDDIDDERREWYGEDADAAMEYQFRFTPPEIRDRAAARHGGQTFYEHMVQIGQALDFDYVVGDETDEQLRENLRQRLQDWRDATHPDAVPDLGHGDGNDHGGGNDPGDGNDGGDGDGHGNENNQGGNHNNRDDHNDGGRDKENIKRGSSQTDTSLETSDSRDNGDDEDDSSTQSTDRTRPMLDSDSERRNPKRRQLSDNASDNGRASRGLRTPERNSLDEAAASQLQSELYQEQPEQTEEEYQQQQDERRDLFFQAIEMQESASRRQSEQQQQRQQLPRQLPRQLQQQPRQEFGEEEEEEEEEERLKTRQEYERDATLARELEEVRATQELVQAHLSRIQETLNRTGRLPPTQREVLEIQTEHLELLRHQEMTIQQRQRVVQQESRIWDRQYQEERLSRQLGRVQNQQNQVRGQLEMRRQRMMLQGYRTDQRLEEMLEEQELHRLEQREEQMSRQFQELQRQIREMENDHRLQEQMWEELRVRQDELEHIREQRAGLENQEDQSGHQQQQHQQQQRERRRMTRDPWPSQLSQQERQNRRQGGSLWSQLDRRDREREREQARRHQQQQERQQGRYPIESQNPPPLSTQHTRWPQGAGQPQPQKQQQGRGQKSRNPAQLQNQPAPPPAWPLRPQQAPQPSEQHEEHFVSRTRSQWSESSSSAGSRTRRRGTNSEETEEEGNQEERSGRGTLGRVHEAALALQRVIEGASQHAERPADQTAGQASNQGSQQLLPPAEITDHRQTPGAVQFSELFTAPRTRQLIPPEVFAGPPPASGGAWSIPNEYARRLRDLTQEKRRISERQAELEQATTRPVIHDNTSLPPSPTPPQRPSRPRHSLPAPPLELPLAPRSGYAQRPQAPGPVEPPIHPQPPSVLSSPAIIQSPVYPRAPASTPERLTLPPFRPFSQPPAQPAESHAAPQPPPPPRPPPQTRPRPGRSRNQITARSPIRKSTRQKRQTSRGKESDAQAAATRRPRGEQTLRQKQAQAQAQPPAQAQQPVGAPAPNRLVNVNPGHAPTQNNSQPQPQRGQSRRQSRRTQPYDVNTLRRSTRNRKPPERYVPPQW